MHSDEDVLFLRSIPNGVLKEFRAEVRLRLVKKTYTTFDSFLPMQTYSGSFIKKNPTMFVDTSWVKIDNLRDFLREREVSVHGMNYLIF